MIIYMAQLDFFTLPEIQFVGGAKQTFDFNLKTQSGGVFNAEGCTVDFSIIYYSNKYGTPVLSKECTLKQDINGIYSIVSVTLTSEDTVSLYDKYIYQLTIVDINGNADIPNQGIMYIANNINKNYLM